MKYTYTLFACYDVAHEFCVLSFSFGFTRMRVISPQNWHDSHSYTICGSYCRYDVVTVRNYVD
jgi:hypothetical protein